MSTNPLDVQVGGDHYKQFEIQPIEFCQRNKIPYCESNVIKYVCRWKGKGGLADLKKAIHNIEILIELEGLNAEGVDRKDKGADPGNSSR